MLQQLNKFAPRRLVVNGGAGAAETANVFRVAGLMVVVEEEAAARQRR